MRIARFPIRLSEEESARRPGSIIVLRDPDSLHHLTEVLRLTVGELLEVFDPTKNLIFRCTLTEVCKDAALLSVVEQLTEVEKLPLTLFCGLPKPQVSDNIVEKATELGLGAVVFFEAQRSQGRLRPDAKSARIRRWERLTQAALKQSGGAGAPKVSLERSLEEALGRYPLDTTAFKCVLAAPQPHILEGTYQKTQESLPFATLLENWTEAADFFLIIGPEGGLTDEELELCLAHSFRPASLGPKILRTETAAVAACACISLHLDARRVKAQFPSPSSD